VPNKDYKFHLISNQSSRRNGSRPVMSRRMAMYKAWLTTAIAAMCVVGFTSMSAVADPASMAMQSRQTAPQTQPPQSTSFWPWSKSAAAAPIGPTAPLAQPVTPYNPYPSAEISPWRHPFKYMQASMSELPIGKSKTIANPVMPPAQPRVDTLTQNGPTAPPTPDFYIFAAQMCEKQGDIAQARQNLGRALSMWPTNADVLRAAARMEDRQGNLAQAESLYQQAVSTNPQNAAALNDLGLCLAREGKLEPSLRAIEQAIQAQPDKALYRNNAATVLVEMRQDQQALAHLATVHNPAEANFNLGQLLVERNRAADAAPYFQAALQLNPGMQQAQDALAKLGAPANVATQATSSPVLAPQAATPSGPSFAPQQQTWPAGPQLSYPATARTPGPGASSYVPPRYLPPIASQPGMMQR
jgi:tetratricopeptide (TPR) repeat protein